MARKEDRYADNAISFVSRHHQPKPDYCPPDNEVRVHSADQDAVEDQSAGFLLSISLNIQFSFPLDDIFDHNSAEEDQYYTAS